MPGESADRRARRETLWQDLCARFLASADHDRCHAWAYWAHIGCACAASGCWRARFCAGANCAPCQPHRRVRREPILLFTCLRNEKVRLPYFLQYYRDLGVDHFLIVDNDSDDGSREYLAAPARCVALDHQGQLQARRASAWTG